MASPPRHVVVDDADSQIRYSGSGWFLDQGSQDNAGNFGPTYKKTSHGTKESGSSFSFSFTGSSITVFGTTALSKNGNTYDPSWECYIDQISIGSTAPFQYEENNWNLCSQGSMNNGPHQLTVNVTSAGATFWFDYLTFIPSPDASYTGAVLQVQYSDSAIQYGSGWSTITTIAQMTTSVGSQMKFDFVGTSLTWVGYIPVELPHNPAKGSYVIDNGGSVNFNLNGIPSGYTSSIYVQPFFTTPDLLPGPHSIVVSYDGGDGPSTPLVLNYLLVTTPSQPANAGTTTVISSNPTVIVSSGSGISSNNPSSTPTVIFNSGVSQVNPSSVPASAAGATAASQSTHTLSSSNPIASSDTDNLSGTGPSGAQTSQSGRPIGAVVGGVVGGLALIALLLLALWCRRRRRHVNRPEVEAAPHLVPAASSSFSSTSLLSTAHAERETIPGTLMSFNAAHGNDADIPVTFDRVRAFRKGENSDRSQSSFNTTTVVHEDSGARFIPSQSNPVVEDIPPLYTAR